MFRRRREPEKPPRSFPDEILAEARRNPGSRVYEIDRAYDPNGAVPPEGIKGAWKVGDDGVPTGEYKANPRYAPARFSAAVAHRDVRPISGDIPPDRALFDVDGALEKTGPEHGIRDDRTLCGLLRQDVMVMRHLWSPVDPQSCSGCRAALNRQ